MGDVELAKVNMAYLGDPASPSSHATVADSHPQLPHSLPHQHHHTIEDNFKTSEQSHGDKTRSGRRSEGRSPGRRLHKTRSRGKVKLLDADPPTQPHQPHPQRLVDAQP